MSSRKSYRSSRSSTGGSASSTRRSTSCGRLGARQVRDEAVFREERPRLLERQIARGDQRLGWGEVVLRQLPALASDHRGHLVEKAVELRLVAGLEGLHRLVVQLVQALAELVVDLVLALSHDPDDHCSSSFCFSPAPSSPFSFASSSSTWLCDEIWASSRSRLEPCSVKSSRAPASVSSSTAAARACICSVLSRARSIASPVSAISSPMPVAASPIRTCASAAEYCALIVSFCVRKDSTLTARRFSLSESLSCCCSRSAIWPSSPWSCCCAKAFRSRAARARSSRPAERAW